MILSNKVLVRFDENLEESDGVMIANTEDKQRNYAVKGTVAEVPKCLVFNDLNEFVKPYSEQEAVDMKNAYQQSVAFNTDMELKVGDRVLFSYMVHFDREAQTDFIDYDMIVAKLDPICPLNGFLLVEMNEKNQFEEFASGMVLYHEDVNEYGFARVKYAGKPVRGYLDYPEVEDDERIVEGSIVMFEKRNAARMEVDIHNSLTENQSSLFKLHRKDVKMFV